MSRDLTKADFLQKRGRRLESVHVPDLGGTAYLQSLYGDELEAWERSRVEQRGSNVRLNAENTRATLLAFVLVSADGRPLGFSPEEVLALGGQDGRALNQLFSKACAMNGLTDSDIEALNRPNSATTPGASSGAA